MSRAILCWIFLCGFAFSQDAKTTVDVGVAIQQSEEDNKPELPDEFAPRQVNARWEIPSAPPVVVQPAATLFTSNGWRCPGCVQQEQILRDSGMVDSQGNPLLNFKIAKVSSRDATLMGGVPRWVPMSGGKILVGSRKADVLKKWLQEQTPAVSSEGRLSRSEIDQWIRANYTRETLIESDVEPRSNVWNHLTDNTDSKHSFTKDQVNGLEQWVALALHNEIHKDNPRILPVRQIASNPPSEWVVHVDGSTSRDVLSAIAEAVRRESDTQPAVQGFLPAIPVDIDDGILDLLDSLMSPDGYRKDGIQVYWGNGPRKIILEPGLYLKFRKVVEVDATVHSLTVDGKTIVAELSGTLVSKLTVKLK